MSEDQVRAVTERWAQAERASDAAAMGELLDADFRGVGPFGFVLDRQQWLDRYEGGLTITAFEWQDPQVRVFGDSAIVIGTQDQKASYQGRPSDGRFRGTQVLVRRGDEWLIAGLHLSPQRQP
ncbi:nuclear transport factor 2 family protein [Actinomadura macrotermitis]|uniref:DUF4440 domain-containing protein n=1 Tax=Actinomadura macrotermitis TaxID=2585200 RepID=A0A7K0BMJ4_9ACTN|nr:nuclear transport factor 2 family protein [Actinomadura macrotermitis]MQY02383.1 hypothetical protein [Actinomadura macrotermitis]